MRLPEIKKVYMIPVIFLLILAASAAGMKAEGASNGDKEYMKHKAVSPGMKHMSHAEMITSEKDFLREMIPHHQEAIDTSVLLYVSTKDHELKELTKSIYMSQTSEILDMRVSYARWYNLIPTGAMYQPMMRDLNIVVGAKRDILYVKDMIVHHQGAVDMAEKVLSINGIHKETVKFANDIIKAQKAEIDLMKNWLTKNQFQ